MSISRIKRGVMAADAIGEHFTQIYNGVFRDARLTGTAKGLFGLISTHRDGYGISIDRLCGDMREGRAAIRAALKNLEDCGYLTRTQQRNADGTVGSSIYEITDMPDGFNAAFAAPYGDPGRPSVENRTTGATSEDTGDTETDETETRRSEPKFDFPTADEPTTGEPQADSRSGKKNNNPENNKHSPASQESAAPAHTRTGMPAREGETPPADEASGDTGDSARSRTHGAGTKHLKSQDGGAKGPKRGVRLPEDWEPDERLLAWAAEKVPGVDPAWETEKFRDHFCASTKAKDRRTLDDGWRRSWQNWMRGAYERQEERRQRRGADLDPELVKAVSWTVDAWWGHVRKRPGATVGASKDALLRLAVDALSAGASIEQVQQALKVCDEACPPAWKVALALQGKPVPGAQARPSVVEATRRDVEQMVADGTAENVTVTPADLFAAVLSAQGGGEAGPGVFDGPAGPVLPGRVEEVA